MTTPAWQLWLLARFPRPIVLLILSIIVLGGIASAFFLIAVTIGMAALFLKDGLIPAMIVICIGALLWGASVVIGTELPKREKKDKP